MNIYIKNLNSDWRKKKDDTIENVRNNCLNCIVGSSRIYRIPLNDIIQYFSNCHITCLLCIILDMSVPCIPKIQSMIEDAWKEGFDPQGASQLNNRLQGTKAWIGACEVYTLLTSLRIKYVPKHPS